MINCNFELTLQVYEESLRDYLSTIKDVEAMSISDLEEMVIWESCKDFNKGDLIVSSVMVVNGKGESVTFCQWFDNYIQRNKESTK